jgi:putative transposase
MNPKDHHCLKYINIQAVYFKLRFTLSYRDAERIMEIKGVLVGHAAIRLWVYKSTPLLESEMKKRKGRAGKGWRLDETYIKVKGIWCY